MSRVLLVPWDEDGWNIVLFAFEPLSGLSSETKSDIGHKTMAFDRERSRVYFIADLWSFTWKSPLTEWVDLKRCGI